MKAFSLLIEELREAMFRRVDRVRTRKRVDPKTGQTKKIKLKQRRFKLSTRSKYKRKANPKTGQVKFVRMPEKEIRKRKGIGAPLVKRGIRKKKIKKIRAGIERRKTKRLGFFKAAQKRRDTFRRKR
jgi:hypothetical protein